MNKIVRFFIGVGIAAIVAVPVIGYINQQESNTKVHVVTSKVTSTYVSIVWNETDPASVREACGGQDVLGCSYRQGSQCVVFVTEIPKNGRSPYLSDTGFAVLNAAAVWGHELAHCVGVDIHGDGKGR